MQKVASAARLQAPRNRWLRSKDGDSEAILPAEESLQVLCGAYRQYQLQGREAALAVRSRALEDHAPADFRGVHAPPETAERRYQEGSQYRAPAIRNGVEGPGYGSYSA